VKTKHKYFTLNFPKRIFFLLINRIFIRLAFSQAFVSYSVLQYRLWWFKKILITGTFPLNISFHSTPESLLTTKKISRIRPTTYLRTTNRTADCLRGYSRQEKYVSYT